KTTRASSPTSHANMARIPTSPRVSGSDQTMFLCIITLAAITALPTRCFAQLTTEPASEALINSLNSSASYADEGLGSLRHISSASVPPRLLSLTDVAPGLLPFFNNAPVFGLDGTVEGNFWHRTQLLGDLNGHRTNLAKRGLFID